jgi:hypothetical protein
MVEQVRVPKGISKDDFLNQVRCGVFDAMHELLMSGGSGSPGDNFFSAVRDGVREAVRATVTAGNLRLVTPGSAPGVRAAEGEAPKEGELPRL